MTSTEPKQSITSEQVYEVLKTSIINGDYAPGEKLKEINLSQQLGTSRTPIRQALFKLESEGLVTTHRGQGARVSLITPDNLKHVYECRAVLEGLAAYNAALRIDGELLTQLEECVILSEQYLFRGENQKVIVLNTRFHDIILDASNNPLLRHMLDQIRSQVLRYRNLTSIGGFRSEFPEEHGIILRAIKNRSPEEAQSAMHKHVQKDMEEMLQRVR